MCVCVFSCALTVGHTCAPALLLWLVKTHARAPAHPARHARMSRVQSSRQAPPIIVWIFAFYIWWLYFRAMPFYNRWVSHAISAMWLGNAYAAGVLMVGVWDEREGDPAWHDWLTWVSGCGGAGVGRVG